MKLLFTGEFLSAERALELGCVDAVVAPEALQEHCMALAKTIASGSPFALQRIKSMLYAGLESDVGAHRQRHTRNMAECFASEDHKEGVASFLEPRPAVFQGR
ncbi:MAG: hypothetical protein E2O54_00835 [Gammaproteobacteria bacterium]|nr:MAG: hypothetical protein E2O54_00835 [Gammaproteobacteria bacterium]